MGKQLHEKTKRNEEIRTLRAKGLTLPAIAEWVKKKYGDDISRQRVHQLASGYVPPTNMKWIVVLTKSIKERDGYCCQWANLCKGKPKKSKDLIVHHLDFDDRNNNPANLITLCIKCHASFHSKNHIDPKIQKNLIRKKNRVVIKCQQCKKEFEVVKSIESTKYCSRKCQIAWVDDMALQFYMLVAIEKKTTREISKEFGLTQTMVGNHIRRTAKTYDLPNPISILARG